MSKKIDQTALEGEVMYNSTEDWLRATVTPEDLEQMDEEIAKLNKLCAQLGVPISGTVIDSSVVEPITDPTRLISTDEV